MKILARYVALRFIGPFLFGLGVFALIVFLGDFFDKLQRIVNSKATAWVVFQYLALQAPYWTVRVVPMATLLATLFAVTGFIQSGEYVAVQAAGVPGDRLFRPLLWLSLAISALGFLAQETLLPACRGRAQHLWRERIHPQWEWDRYHDVVLVAGPDRFVTANLFTVKEGTMIRPVMDQYGATGISRQVDAGYAGWDAQAGAWTFRNGVERLFNEDGGLAQESLFEELKSDLRIPPKELMPRQRDPDEMSVAETRLYLKRLKLVGEPPYRAQTALQAKLAYPFANVILCALGIPIALRLRRAARGASFATALAVGFAYIWLIETCKTMGNVGRLPAVLAAWLPNAAFGGLAVWLHRRWADY